MKRLSVLSLFIFASILISCAPQVTVTSEVTVTLPPPTDTPIPTPTSHPQFIALQEQITASGTRFSLLPDGTIEEMTADGGRQTVPNLTVSPEGVMTIMVDGQPVILDRAKTHFSDEIGFTNDDYVYVETTGEYKPAAPPIESTEIGRSTMAILEQLNIPEGVVRLEMDGESVVCIDVATGEQVCKDGEFKSNFVIEMVKLYGDAKATQYGPKKGNVPEGTATDEVSKNVSLPLVKRVGEVLMSQNNGEPVLTIDRSAFIELMLSKETNSWGVKILVDRSDPNAPKYFAYEKESGDLVLIPLM